MAQQFGGTPPRCSCGFQPPAPRRRRAKRQLKAHMATCEVRTVHVEAKQRWIQQLLP